MQEQFIKYLKEKAQDNTSFVDEIAGILDIGYDAAYRRINLKTNLSLEESVVLARHYKISLNKLFEIGNQNTIIAELPPEPKNEIALEHWLKVSLQNVQTISKVKSAEIFYSAKDIPVFHTLSDSFLTRYKMYVWLKDLNIDMAKSQISFDEWMKTIPDSLLQSAFALGNIYKNINITELWNDNTVTGTLQQILYYFEAGLVSKDVALKICEDVHNVISETEKQTIEQSIGPANNQRFFHLYKCDLHMLTNTIMVRTPHKKVFYSPFTVLSYFKIEHKDTCEMMNDFLNKQMSNSKLLATAGERDRTLFFKTVHQKISIAQERINMDHKMTFL
ncbi:hypothetical protein E1J38_005120 [Seonamhaeicola sediminis]|uniref:Transcription regulator BetR N-terminal domain-containing protein n=1 Tax=Seonamhaeicola sediminis TaxID=2528206 RepID=A0A562YF53_9FLAO|nr:hypothetical protein [Seonamhaeicola sediminis]TWO33279.1 hypothetical protein E1J38_005120 [Seonamhaeicola sediminis]